MYLKDHYKTLGVGADAATVAIKKAYRALAVRYHPDKNPGDVFCEARFREVAEAYYVLSDKDRRAAYDNERWLSGMGHGVKGQEAVTPAWLYRVCTELNVSLALMDTHRMSQSTLQAYIMLILSDAHIGVLHREGNVAERKAIIDELIKATARLELRYLDMVINGMMAIAAGDTGMNSTVQQYATRRAADDRRQRMFPYVVIAVTLALCIFMYLYAAI